MSKISDLIVTIKEIKKIQKHQNSDNLELAIVDGWQCVIAKDSYKEGDLVLHIPPDALVKWDLAESFGIAKYLSGYYHKGEIGHQFCDAGRVNAIRLRQEISHGCVLPNNDNYQLGEDVATIYGITKYEPPKDMSWNQGGMAKPNSNLNPYTDVQNFRNFTNIFEDGEVVVSLEKIHGTNSVIGCIICEGIENTPYEIMISSRENRRKIGEGSLYEQPLILCPTLGNMLVDMYNHYTTVDIIPKSVIVYSEIYGHVQKYFGYGHPNNYAFACFDISVDGRYLNWDEVVQWCTQYNVPLVPEVYRGPFNTEKMWELSKGNTLMPNANHIREGIVVKCLTERFDPRLRRVILKFVNDDYLDFFSRKGGTDYH